MKPRTNSAPGVTPQKPAGRGKLSPAIQTERALVLNALHPIVTMLGTIVGPNIEIVLHDLMQPESSVIAIANGHISNRSIGSSIINGPKYDKGFAAAKREISGRGEAVHTIIQDYATATSAGQELKSATVIFRDANGDPFATLCLNADLSVFHMAHAWLDRLLQPNATPEPSRAARGEEPEMDTLMKEIISDAVHTFSKPVTAMTKEEKIHAVQEMMQRGLFMVRGGVERAATALHVSRFTIYNYQEELRRRDGLSGGKDGATAKPAAPKAVKKGAVRIKS
jgi:predicted transcriptional regulator YheO